MVKSMEDKSERERIMIRGNALERNMVVREPMVVGVCNRMETVGQDLAKFQRGAKFFYSLAIFCGIIYYLQRIEPTLANILPK